MSDYEQFVLDGLALNDATFTLESISDPPAAKKPEWVGGADSDGAILGRDPKYDNKVIELRLRVSQQATMDLALTKVGLVLDKLQETSRNANGLALVWTPADATTAAITWRCLLGEITDLPKDWQDSGWFVRSPAFTVRLTTLPFGHGAETLLGTTTSTDPLIALELSGIAGDVPALGRLVVTDAASQSRRWVAWGLESRWLPTSSPPSLIVDSTSMVTSGFAGTTATRSGAYSGASNNVISATLRTQAQAIAGLGNLSHVGSFRPHLRFYASATAIAARLTFQTLDGPFRSLTYKVPVVAGWNFVDLGLVTIPQTSLGTQRWTGRIEAYSTDVGGETFQADVVLMIPAEAFGRARGSYVYAPGVLAAYDDFSGRTAAAVITAVAAPLGGSWTSAGSTTDFAAADAPAATDETVSRTTTSDTGNGRIAVIGSSVTNTEVGVKYLSTAIPGSGRFQGVVARYVDANNYLRLGHVSSTSEGDVWLETVIGGVASGGYLTLGRAATANTWYGLRLVVFASGSGVASWLDSSGGVLDSSPFYISALATGGTLASGKAGITDLNASATAATRYYDEFYAATPSAEAIAIHSGQSIEFRHDTSLREDSTGTYAGPPPEYVGSRFFIPPAGGPGREARIAVAARRNDVSTQADDNIADSTTVAVYGTPRYLAIPR